MRGRPQTRKAIFKDAANSERIQQTDNQAQGGLSELVQNLLAGSVHNMAEIFRLGLDFYRTPINMRGRRNIRRPRACPQPSFGQAGINGTYSPYT